MAVTVLLTACTAAEVARAQSAPPPPSKSQRKFPMQKRDRPEGKILRLSPNQKHVSPAELRSAPTASQVAAKRDKGRVVVPPKSPAKRLLVPPGVRRGVLPVPATGPSRKPPPQTPPPKQPGRSGAAPAPAAPAPAAAAPQELLSKLKPHERYVLQRYPQLAAEITPENLDAHLRALTRGESRVVGYAGEKAAADYVRAQFLEVLGTNWEETFPVTTPIDRGGER